MPKAKTICARECTQIRFLFIAFTNIRTATNHHHRIILQASEEQHDHQSVASMAIVKREVIEHLLVSNHCGCQPRHIEKVVSKRQKTERLPPAYPSKPIAVIALE